MHTFVNTLTYYSETETWESDWNSWQGKVNTLITTVKAKDCMRPPGSDLVITQKPSQPDGDRSHHALSISMQLKYTCSVNQITSVKMAILQAFGPEWGMAEAWHPGNISYVLRRAWRVFLKIDDAKSLQKKQDNVIATIAKTLNKFGKSDEEAQVKQDFVGYKHISWWFYPSRTYNAKNRTSIGVWVKTALAESNTAIGVKTAVNIEAGCPRLSISIKSKVPSEQCQMS